MPLARQPHSHHRKSANLRVGGNGHTKVHHVLINDITKGDFDDDVPLVDPGRSLPLRLLALLGALGFVMLGLSSLVPLLGPPSPPPPAPALQDQRNSTVS